MQRLINTLNKKIIATIFDNNFNNAPLKLNHLMDFMIKICLFVKQEGGSSDN